MRLDPSPGERMMQAVHHGDCAHAPLHRPAAGRRPSGLRLAAAAAHRRRVPAGQVSGLRFAILHPLGDCAGQALPGLPPVSHYPHRQPAGKPKPPVPRPSKPAASREFLDKQLERAYDQIIRLNAMLDLAMRGLRATIKADATEENRLLRQALDDALLQARAESAKAFADAYDARSLDQEIRRALAREDGLKARVERAEAATRRARAALLRKASNGS